MRQARGTGWIPNAYDPRDRHVDELLGATPARTDQPDMTAFRGKRIYQGGAGACTAFAGIRIIDMSYRAHLAVGDPQPVLGSPWKLYVDSRRQPFAGQDPRTLPPLKDEGAVPRYVLKSAQKLGFCAWDDAPYLDSRVNQTPPPAAYMKGYDLRGLEYFAIPETGLARAQLVAASLARHCPVMFGVTVDQMFLAGDGTKTIERIVPDGTGRHMLAALKVDFDAGVVIFDNWWSEWGKDGLGAMSLSVFNGGLVSDVTAVKSVPKQILRSKP